MAKIIFLNGLWKCAIRCILIKNQIIMKKLLLLVVLFASLTGFKQSNNRQISGTVFDKDDKKPIPGASIIIPGTKTGTTTDANGKFTLDVPDGKDRIICSFIGYAPQVVNIDHKDSLKIYLAQSYQSLNEVVVVKGYTSQKKNNKTYAVQNISPPSGNVLQGQATGVMIRGMGTVNQNSGYLAPENSESYSAINENGFNTVKANPLSTFSVDVDAASYSNVRRYINNGQLPPADAVRIEEMINYFSYNLPGPGDNDPVAIHTELSSAPWNAKHRLLRIGLKAKTIEPKNLPAANLVFLIDVSGSMNEPNKLPLVKASMKMLAAQLRPKDRVAIVVYAGQAGLVLPSTAGDNKEKIDSAIDALNAGGSTAGGEGIKLAYRIAKANFMPHGNNRIVMATDGDFNVGPASDEDMEQLIVKQRDSKVVISIMGFGMGNLKDSKMETLADKGNGNYAYIDNITEARKAFVTEFGGTLFTVAKDVKLQVEFNPAKVQAYRLLGYEDRMLAKEDFNNDKKDAGEMGSGHTVTALYEIVPAGIKDDYSISVDPLKYQKPEPLVKSNNSDEMLTIKFRYKKDDSSASRMQLTAVKDQPKKLDETSVDFRFAAAVAEFGMLLRDSPFKQESTFDQVIHLAKGAKGDDKEGYRSEFVRLAESAQLMSLNGLAAK